MPRLVKPPIEHLNHVDVRRQSLGMATIPTLPCGIWVGQVHHTALIVHSVAHLSGWSALGNLGTEVETNHVDPLGRAHLFCRNHRIRMSLCHREGDVKSIVVSERNPSDPAAQCRCEHGLGVGETVV